VSTGFFCAGAQIIRKQWIDLSQYMQQRGPLLCSGDNLHTMIMRLGHQGFLRRPSSGHDREDGFKSWRCLITHLSRIVVSIFVEELGNFDNLPPFTIGWIFHVDLVLTESLDL